MLKKSNDLAIFVCAFLLGALFMWFVQQPQPSPEPYMILCRNKKGEMVVHNANTCPQD